MIPQFTASSADEDPFILRRRLLGLVLFFLAVVNTTLLVPSNKFSDTFLQSAGKVIVIICGLSISVVALMWTCGRIFGQEDTRSADGTTSMIESTYDSLSKQQQKRLDMFRTEAIRLYLKGYSMQLRQENMITTSDESTTENEMLIADSSIPIIEDEENGHDVKGIDNNNAHMIIHIPNENSKDDKNSLIRKVPNSCSICLADYEFSNSVSWSGNPQCPHIFHEKCITKWFVSLGRLQSISGLPPLEDGSPTKVLNYKLECPCCRQEFMYVKE